MAGHAPFPPPKRNLGPTRHTHAKVGHVWHLKWIFGLLFAYAVFDNLPSSVNHLRTVTVGRVEESNLFPVPVRYNEWYAQRICGYFHPEKAERCDNYLREHYDDFYNEIKRRRNRGYYTKLNYTPFEKGNTRPNFVELGSVKTTQEEKI